MVRPTRTQAPRTHPISVYMYAISGRNECIVNLREEGMHCNLIIICMAIEMYHFNLESQFYAWSFLQIK